ncbi:MAG: P-II family nitrogen regulator [Erythrobacter sp.]
MTETIIRRRIEVLADEPLIPAIERIAGSAGIEHYTLMPTVGGMGHSGRWRDDQISGATAKVMFMAVTSEEGADRLTDLLSPLLATHHLILLVSNVEVIRPQRFD